MTTAAGYRVEKGMKEEVFVQESRSAKTSRAQAGF